MIRIAHVLFLIFTVTQCYARNQIFCDIQQPSSDWHVVQGDEIYLRGQWFTEKQFNGQEDLIRESTAFEFQWLISDGRVFEGSEPGLVVFETPGEFTITFIARNEQGDQDQDTRMVTVEAYGQTKSNAIAYTKGTAVFSPGSYAHITLSIENSTHSMPLHINSTNQVLKVGVSPEFSNDEFNLISKLLDSNGLVVPLSDHMFSNPGYLFEVSGLALGDYTLQFSTSFAGLATQEFVFSYSSEIFPREYYFNGIDISSDTQHTIYTSFHGPDPYCSVEYTAYTETGEVSEKLNRVLRKGQCRNLELEAIFSNPAEVAWVLVHATKEIKTALKAQNHQQTWIIGLSPESYGEHELIIPHIPYQTDTWNSTLSVISNAPVDQVQLTLLDEFFDIPLPVEARSHQSISLNQLIPGTTLNPTTWATLSSNNHSNPLLSTLTFERTDGLEQKAALNLHGQTAHRSDFTYFVDRIFLSHIAKPDSGFWTGIAITHLEDHLTSFKAIFYNESGQFIGHRTQSIDRYEKRLFLAKDFYMGYVYPGSTPAWIEIETSSSMIAYQLFGTTDQKHSRLAAIPGISHGTRKLFFPNVDVDEDNWYGISLLNLSDEPGMLTIKGIDEFGTTVVIHHLTLNPKEKLIGTIEEVFNTLFIQQDDAMKVKSLSIESSTPITGFALFGNHSGTTLGATPGSP